MADARGDEAVLGRAWAAAGQAAGAAGASGGGVAALLAGPARLHAATHEACAAELQRLERAHPEALRALCAAMSREARAACQRSRLPEEGVDAAAAAIAPAAGGGPHQGQVRARGGVGPCLQLLRAARRGRGQRPP